MTLQTVEKKLLELSMKLLKAMGKKNSRLIAKIESRLILIKYGRV
jgi:hypothetical protein